MLRGSTLLEITIVMAVATTLTTAGIVSSTSIVREARYRADRSRLFLDIKEARDRASAGMTGVIVKEEVSGTSLGMVRFIPSPICSPGDLAIVAGTTLIDYPSIDHNADRALCFNGSTMTSIQMVGAPPPPGTAPFLNFIEAGVGASNDAIGVAPDGRLSDNWGEFPKEGALDASDCDVDVDPSCGK